MQRNFLDEEFPTRVRFEQDSYIYYVTVKVSFTWQKIQHTIQNPIILKSLDMRCASKEVVIAWEDSYNKERVRYDDKVIA